MLCACNMKRLHFGIERERCLSIEWVWSIRANAGCHEHRRSKFALMNIQISNKFCGHSRTSGIG